MVGRGTRAVLLAVRGVTEPVVGGFGEALFYVGAISGVGGRYANGVAVVEWRRGITCERVKMGLWVDGGNGVGGVRVRVVCLSSVVRPCN